MSPANFTLLLLARLLTSLNAHCVGMFSQGCGFCLVLSDASSLTSCSVRSMCGALYTQAFVFLPSGENRGSKSTEIHSLQRGQRS